MTTVRTTTFFSMEALHRAWVECRRRKRSSRGAIAFETKLFDELAQIQQSLIARTWRPSPCVRFATQRPKLREIVAASFRDRVVHHLFVRQVEPDWEKVFIYDSFACRKNKGTHAAVDRLAGFVSSTHSGRVERGWYLQLDIRSFFMPIRRDILSSRIDRRLRKRFGLLRGVNAVATAGLSDQQCLALPGQVAGADADGYGELHWLAGRLIHHDAISGSVVRGDPALLARVPHHKTLSGCKPGCGLPIGNLTSQFFANVYLDALDQFVKHELKVRRYVRYVDDFVLVHEDPARLEHWRERIEHFLDSALKLALNEKRVRLRPLTSGIDFLGYVVHPSHRLVRRRVVGNLKERLRLAERVFFPLETENAAAVARQVFPERAVVGLEASLNSYLAHFAKADARRLSESPWKSPYRIAAVVGRHGNKAVRLDRPRRCPPTLVRQFRWFSRRTRSGVLFFQVGSHFELLNDHARKFGKPLGLRTIASRPGFCGRCGFHRRYLSLFIERALQAGMSVTVVQETGRRTAMIRERRITARCFSRDQQGEIA